MTRGRVVAVGLGPAGVDLLTPQARRALETAPVVLARTERHPAVDDLRSEGLRIRSLDHHYEEADDLDAAYAGIVAEVLAAARDHDHVAYAVPGSPAVAELTVGLLRAEDVDVEVVPGLSFAELAWAVAGVDGMADSPRVVDGRSLQRTDVLVGGHLLVAQCDRPSVLSAVKLTLLEELGAEHPVIVLQRLGRHDAETTTLELADLDRDVDPDHLTSVLVDLGETAGVEFVRFVDLIETLRGPGGCPWDAEQTHHSLVRHLVEEAYEVVVALERLPADAPGGTPIPPGDYAHVAEELGDLTAQVVFHATLARETGAFTMRHVLRGIREKLVHRHPHVFAGTEVETAADVARNWEQLKRREKQDRQGGSDVPASLVDDVPASLPGLLHAHKLYRKAEAAGLPLPSGPEAADRVVATTRRLIEHGESASTSDAERLERLLGDLVAAVALLARDRGIDAERALRGWSRRFRDRFRAAEALARERGGALDELDGDTVVALWIQAGSATAGSAGTGPPGPSGSP